MPPTSTTDELHYYDTKFRRLKEKLFYPELEEIKSKFEQMWTSKHAEMVEEVTRRLSVFDSKAKEFQILNDETQKRTESALKSW